MKNKIKVSVNTDHIHNLVSILATNTTTGKKTSATITYCPKYGYYKSLNWSKYSGTLKETVSHTLKYIHKELYETKASLITDELLKQIEEHEHLELDNTYNT